MTKKNILQIHYDDASKRMLDPGFIPLEIAGNPRADWREYWGIRDFFLNNHLDEDTYYGFLSPLFRDKTRLSAQQVEAWMESQPGADVYTFSPSMSDSACYVNVFEQGNRRHPGLLEVTREFLHTIDLEVDFRTLLNDFRTCVFCNYIIAKPVFWQQWFAIGEVLFETAERNETPLAAKLNQITDYGKGSVEMKVFLVERLGSLILALAPELKVINQAIGNMSYGDPLFFPCRKEMLMLNALKVAYIDSRDVLYLDLFYTLRKDVLIRCDTGYRDEGRLSFFDTD